ncbi:uncharacterized protein LOC113152482 [Anabas testudineus]|uniref:uncharacterized protein LOC113152482 n=1 Tax=Anabas testudineus TaxID=64144 RepID=UPI000E4612DC|nr:uncharacterized protein LOC113152482 [Anabas testudineus]
MSSSVTFSGIIKASAVRIEIPEQICPPSCHTITRPPLVLIPRRLWLPVSHKQSVSHTGPICPNCLAGVWREEESIQHRDRKTQQRRRNWRYSPHHIHRDMGGKEKNILVIANISNYQGSDKKTLCNDSLSGKNNGKLPPSAVPPPIPMSPIVEKMEGLKAIRNRSNSLRLGRLAFYRHLEKVETMRSFWEHKQVELKGGNQQVTHTAVIYSS